MSDGLLIEKDQVSMFYYGDVPWHGLGTCLDNPATSAEAIKAAKLDWEVVKLPLEAIDPITRTKVIVNDQFALAPKHKLSEENCPIFGIVGKKYTPLQNSEAFQFFDSIVGEGKAIYHTAGALYDGRKIWILAKLPKDIILRDDDCVGKYLLLSNTHDGSSCVEITFTPIRVVCQNTLIAALSENKRTGRVICVPHLPNIKKRLEMAKELLGIIGDAYRDIENVFRKMLLQKIAPDEHKQYVNAVLPESTSSDPERREEENRLIYKHRADAIELAFTGRGNEKIHGTLWSAYNGITEMVDYTRALKREKRLASIWFGNGAKIKLRAYNLALRLLRK